MDWKNFILCNGVDDILVSGPTEVDDHGYYNLTCYYDAFFIKTANKILRFKLEDNWEYNIGFIEKITPYWLTEYDHTIFSKKNIDPTGYISIYRNFFRTKSKINIIDIKHINNNGDCIIFKYRINNSKVCESIISSNVIIGILFGKELE
ncbi:hypothetical protein [Bartonella sp. HY038]|uniref:hypothetical protein n=1 Tax=Bartonella sp. HY038 TaxID=2759660 RepID=UPI0015FDE0F6|nr:hypothetical protein [Bartonella sp. HY038]